MDLRSEGRGMGARLLQWDSISLLVQDERISSAEEGSEPILAKD